MKLVVAYFATTEIWIRFCRLTKNIYFCGVKGEFVEGMTTLIAQAVSSPKSSHCRNAVVFY